MAYILDFGVQTANFKNVLKFHQLHGEKLTTQNCKIKELCNFSKISKIFEKIAAIITYY